MAGPLPFDIGLIFSAVGLARSVAEFAGVLDSIEAKLDRLVQCELNAGLRALDQAACASSEQTSLLREARTCFNKAVSLEMAHRKVVALLGLALCHHWLEDGANRSKALEEILEVNPVTTLKLALRAGSQFYGLDDYGDPRNPLNLARWQFNQIYRNPKKNVLTITRLALSGEYRRAFYKDLVLKTVESSEEARAVRRIQESVSQHLGRPIAWLKALE